MWVNSWRAQVMSFANVANSRNGVSFDIPCSSQPCDNSDVKQQCEHDWQALGANHEL